ncbi:phosphoribosyltransferase family protein, partial [Streptomyces scabiei]|uniref:phosphoribosyltransferase family protein n=1 Tax=Streptomyces scabiei TaxID=1930 RepID=UPI0039F1097B
GCVFEYVYLARPDPDIAGRNVYLSRVEMGRKLAKEAPAEADLVIATPESGTPAAIGYAEASGIPFGNGLVKNAYVGRTFIQPSQTIRQLGIRLKLNPLKEVIKGKRLVVVDDSIVRGNTQRALVRMLREAGAAEVHIRISSPPVKWPCFFGIDFATRAELIANGMSVEEIGTSMGADSLAYISIDGMIEATTIAKPNLCRACFDGEYPMELPGPELLGKQLLETELAAGPAGTAAADAIRLLRKQDAGRAALLLAGAPDDVAHETRVDGPPYAADLVRGPADLMPAVRRLLRGIVVVATLEDAEDLVYARPGLTAVTAEGDLLWDDARARAGEPADAFTTARVALPAAAACAASPLDRHPARIAVPVLVEGYGVADAEEVAGEVVLDVAGCR